MSILRAISGFLPSGGALIAALGLIGLITIYQIYSLGFELGVAGVKQQQSEKRRATRAKIKKVHSAAERPGATERLFKKYCGDCRPGRGR